MISQSTVRRGTLVLLAVILRLLLGACASPEPTPVPPTATPDPTAVPPSQAYATAAQAHLSVVGASMVEMMPLFLEPAQNDAPWNSSLQSHVEALRTELEGLANLDVPNGMEAVGQEVTRTATKVAVTAGDVEALIEWTHQETWDDKMGHSSVAVFEASQSVKNTLAALHDHLPDP